MIISLIENIVTPRAPLVATIGDAKVFKNGREVSAWLGLVPNALDFFRSLISPYRLLNFITGFLADLFEFALKDKHRKKRRLACQQLMDTAGHRALT